MGAIAMRVRFFLFGKESTKNTRHISIGCSVMERKMGIEPTPSAWEAEVLPLNYSRKKLLYYMPFGVECQVFLLKKLSAPEKTQRSESL